MSNVLDLTVLPAKVTIKNIAKDHKLTPAIIAADVDSVKQDVGTTHAGAIDMQEAEAAGTVYPAVGTEIQMFGRNLFKKLETEDSIILKVETSKELLYWELIKDKFSDILEVTVESFDSSEDGKTE